MSDSDKVFESIGEIKADIIHLKMDLKDNGALSSIKNNLDIIFPDAKCKQVIITENTDKPFFESSSRTDGRKMPDRQPLSASSLAIYRIISRISFCASGRMISLY